jgi:hypothetical protein
VPAGEAGIEGWLGNRILTVKEREKREPEAKPEMDRHETFISPVKSETAGEGFDSTVFRISRPIAFFAAE